ncbi:sensor histidine kinase [Streptomyces flavofungini]|uniref:histidine kinase n=1 Tax=Streptomyces flavofungini TaxID=68200 RepID=A0ABS0XD40_9ACTN|nr:sensor histidine kinase [Streptomyces flavofungini]MBJ3811110.1 sensor histidine kinase [Streptomyces flavofungini]GHC43948.1 two-component sensor histidine kinase [Streptomyces flavofungini]
MPRLDLPEPPGPNVPSDRTRRPLRTLIRTRSRALSRHPYVVDAALAALVLFAVSLQFVFPDEGDDRLSAVGFLLGAGTAVPLAWRRRSPMTAVYLVSLFTPAMAVYRQPPPDVAYGGLVALYTLALVARPVQRRVLLGVWLVASTATMTFREQAQPFEYAFHLLSFVTAYGFGVLARVQRAYTAALEDRARRLERERAAETARAVARERARIARDMHDVLAHAVSLMVVQAEAGPVVVRDDPARAITAFDAISGAGRDAMAQLRRILGVLRDAEGAGDGAGEGGAAGATGVAGTAGGAGASVDRGPQPTLAALPSLIRDVELAGTPVESRVTGEPVALRPDVEVAAYRVAQEALTNVLKHAGTARVTFQLAWLPGELTLTVTDDGARAGPNGTPASRAPFGTAPHSGERPRGQGLVGIAERAAACGGTAESGPVPAGGFRVAVRLPTASLTDEHPRSGGRRPGAGPQRLHDDP